MATVFSWNTVNITAADSPYTVLAQDVIVVADVTAGAITVQLATANITPNQVILVRRLDASLTGNIVTVLPQVSYSILGSVSATLSTHLQELHIYRDATALSWRTLAGALSPQVVNVKTSGAGSGEFTSVSAALASITDNTSTKTYVIEVGPGIYTEPPITGKPFVVIKGVNALDVTLSCSTSTGTAYTAVDASVLYGVTITGASGSGGVGVRYSGSGLSLPFFISNCTFGNNETNLRIYGNGNPTTCVTNEITAGGAYNCTNCVVATNDGSTVTNFAATNWFVRDISSPYMTTTFDISGSGVVATIKSSTFELNNAGLSGSTCTSVYNGAQLRMFSSVVKGYKNGVWNPATGTAADIHMDGVIFDSSCMFYLRVEHSGTTGNLMGIVDIKKMFVNHSSGFAIEGNRRFIIPVATNGSVHNTVKSAIQYINPTLSVNVVSGSATMTSSGLFHTQLTGATVTGSDIPPGTTATFVNDSTMTLSALATGTSSPSAKFQVSSSTKKYIVDVGPGNYSEANPILVDDYVSVAGRSNATIIAANASSDILQIGANVTVRSLTLAGAAGAGAAGISADSVAGCYLAEVTIASCDIGIKCTAETGLCQGVINGLILQDVSTTGVWLDGTVATSAAPVVWSSGIGLINITTGSPNIFLVEGPYARITIANTNIIGTATTSGVVIRDGCTAEISTLGTRDCLDGIRVENVGSAPHIVINGGILDSSANLDLNVLHPGTTGVFSGIVDRTAVYIEPTSTMSLQYLDSVSNGLTNVGSLFLGSNNTTSADVRESIDNVALTSGVYSGGVISVSSGLTVSVATGIGYLVSVASPHTVKKYSWTTQGLLLPASTTSYVYVTSGGTLTSNAAKPSDTQAILLGRVRTDASAVEFIDLQSMRTDHISNRYDQFHRNAIGSVVASGITVSSNASRQLAVSSGKYYYSGSEFNPTGGAAPVSFTTYYHVASVFSKTDGVTVFSNTQYDDGTGLVSTTASYYMKHALYMLGAGVTEKYMMVFSSDEYVDLAAARAGDSPTPPNYFSEGIILIASIITQQGVAAYTEIGDRRPTITTNVTSIASSLTHGSLLSLTADDHPQYLLENGTRAMSGALDMGTFAISNVGTVDGVTVSAHASRHLPNGSDALTSAAPLANLTATTTNATGTANSFARSDHSHAITTAAAVSIGSANAIGVSTSLARADHVHQGIHQLKANSGGSARYGDLILAGGTGTTIVDDGAGTFTWNVALGGVQDNTLAGTLAGASITTGNGNTLIGSSAGTAITEGQFNVHVGYLAGSTATDGTGQIAIGYLAVGTGNADDNTGIGTEACRYTSGNQNICIGKIAGKGVAATSTFAGCVFIGGEAGAVVTSGGFGTFVGYRCGPSVTTGTYNNLFGNECARLLAGGTDNCIFGRYAGAGIVLGSGNCMFGNNAGENYAGDYSVAIGYMAANARTSGLTVSIGYQAGRYNTGDGNTMIGNEAGHGTTIVSTCDYTTAIGEYAGYSLTTGSDNSIVGAYAGESLETGDSNCLFGVEAAPVLVAGDENCVIGSYAGTALTGFYSVIVGAYASVKSVGNPTTSVGWSAGRFNTGTANTFIGLNSGRGADGSSTGANNTCVGNQSGLVITTGTQNTFIGTNAGVGVLTGNDNTIIGYNAGSSITTGTDNIIIGAQVALYTGSASVIIGTLASASLTSNTVTTIGYAAAQYNTGSGNTFVGYFSGRGASGQSTGSSNVCVGQQAGEDITSGNFNTNVGVLSGSNITSGTENVCVGLYAGSTITTTSGNVVIGVHAGNGSTFATSVAIGSYAATSTVQIITAVGYQAGRYNSGSANTYLGYGAGLGVVSTSTGSNNTVVGYNAGVAMTSAADCVIIGTNAGDSLTTGLYNVLIGYNAGQLITTTSGSVVIGTNAADINTQISTSVGYTAGRYFTGVGNTFYGYMAGVGVNGTSSGTYNVVMGHGAGLAMTSAAQNTIIGALAGDSLLSGGSNVLIGYGVSTAATTLGSSVVIGHGAHGSTTGGLQCVIIGMTAGTLCSATGSTIIGMTAAVSAAGNPITAVGFLAGRYQTGSFGTFIGYQAGQGANGSSNASYNTAVGYSAGNALTTGAQNTFVGYFAGGSVAGGTGNTIIGDSNFASLTTGGQNVVVGYSNSCQAASTSSVVIGTSNVIGHNSCILLGHSITTSLASHLYLGSSGVPLTTTTTAPAAGGAGALPATPAGYLYVYINSTLRRIPYY